MAQEDRLYPLRPSGDVRQPVSGWPLERESVGSIAASTDADDYTFTEDGLKDGVSVGEARRLSPMATRYRVEPDDGAAPWSSYAEKSAPATPATPAASAAKPHNGTDTAFRGSSLGDVEDYLRTRLEHLKSQEESDDDRKKRERRERRHKNLAALGDILGSFHRAYSHARGERAMDLPNVSETVRNRMDRARAEREKNADRILNYAITLDKLNDSEAERSYRQERLRQYQQQQDRLDKQEENNRSIAEARVKYYEAQSNKNDEQAAYWKTKAELLERGWPQEQAEQAARIEERKARAAKYSHDANAPYRSSGGTGGRKGTSKSASVEDDGTMLGRIAVEDPEGLQEAVMAATGAPYTTINNQNKKQIAGAYRAQQRRKQTKQQPKQQPKQQSKSQQGGSGKFSSFSIHKSK